MDGPILPRTPLELGSDAQATKALNGTHPSPGSSSAHELMLQALPSRPFLAFHIIFRIATELYKGCAMRKDSQC